MIFGLRKSQLDLTHDKSTPPELVIDAVIASIVAVQMWLLTRKEIDLICDVAEVDEHLRKQNGAYVISKLHLRRNERMAEIRAKFIRMHEFCNLVSQNRVEKEEENDWKRYLLKSRLRKSRLESSAGRASTAPIEVNRNWLSQNGHL